MRELLRKVRRTPERLLHPLRRRKAFEALRARARPKTLLVICHGNICRSPVAAGLLRRALEPDGIAVESAGLIGFNRPAPPAALAAAGRHGLDLSDHRSKLLTAKLARTVDLIVVMEAGQQRQISERYGRRPADIVMLGDFDPWPVDTRTIRDPVNDGPQIFDEVYERIARCARELALTLSPAGATSS
jgi:protein-tyrosine phosphatase